MFTDIVGYSAIMSLDEKKALKTIGKNRELHKSAIKQFKGEYIKEIGDNTISSFDSALNAVSCAVYIQQSLKDDPELNLRIGIHIGDIVIQSNDILGDSINIASRIETFAKNGDICISGHVYNYIHNIPGIEVEPVNDIQTGDLKHDEKFFFLRYENYPEELTSFSVSENEKTIYPFFFWQELRRRKVIKAATMYAAGAFGILEAFDILFPNVIVPDWLVYIISIVVIAGFAITVYISWRYEVTSEGIQITEPIGTITDDKKVSKRQGGLRQWLSVSNIVIALLLIMVGILIYPKLFQKDKFKNVRNDDGRISLAVMPFKNLTGDTLYNVWQEGLQNLLISTLTNSKELSVRQFSTMYTAIDKTDMQNYASITPSLAGEIAQNLDSKTFILGNILKYEDKIRISAQLVNAKTEEIYKSYQIDGWAEDDIFTMSDSLANFIKRYFDIKVIIDDFGYPENFEMTKTSSAEALRYYIMGMESFILFDYIKSIEWLQRAIEIDSNFVSAYFLVSMSYYNIGQYSTGLEWFETAYQKGEIQASVIEKLELEWLRTLYKETPYEQLEYIEQILKIEDQSIFYLYLLGWKNVMVDQ